MRFAHHRPSRRGSKPWRRARRRRSRRRLQAARRRRGQYLDAERFAPSLGDANRFGPARRKRIHARVPDARLVERLQVMGNRLVLHSQSTACAGVIEARRSISRGVAPKPARSMRCAARAALQSEAASGERSSTHPCGPTHRIAGGRRHTQREPRERHDEGDRCQEATKGATRRASTGSARHIEPAAGSARLRV